MKKTIGFISLLVILLGGMSMLIACSTPTDDEPEVIIPPHQPPAGNKTNTWTAEAEIGEDEDALTTYIRISFNDPVDKIEVAMRKEAGYYDEEGEEEVEPREIPLVKISGAADSKLNINMMTGEFQKNINPDTEEDEGILNDDTGLIEWASGIKQDGNNWLIPIFANYTGDAIVEIQDDSDKIDKEPQKVPINGKFTLPEPGKYVNFMGIPESYTGTPFIDEKYPQTADNDPADSSYYPKPYPINEKGQIVPGRVMTAFYDEGGQGVTFNTNGRNEGAEGGYVNGTYYSSFRRENPAPSVSAMHALNWTASPNNMQRGNGDSHDFHLYSMVFNPDDHIKYPYIGWTGSGQWVRMTLDVQETGLYEVRQQYTNTTGQANSGKYTRLTLDFDPTGTSLSQLDPDTIVECQLPGTQNTKDPTGWRRGPHHWNKCVIGYMYLKEGQCVMTMRQYANDLNYGYFEFTLIEP